MRESVISQVMRSHSEISWDEARIIANEVVSKYTGKYLSDLEVKVLQGAWEGQTYEEIAKKLNFTPKYLQNDVGAKFWKKLSEALGETVSKSNFRQSLIRQSEKEKLQSFSPWKTNLEVPNKPVPLNSRFYIERYCLEFGNHTIESVCYQAIAQPAALIRVKAPRQMGKTSLLDKILDKARHYNYRTVRLNIQDIDEAKFNNLDQFLRWFCAYIGQELELPDRVNDFWQEDTLGSKISCKTYLQEYLLKQIDTPLVLGCDEVDRIIPYPAVAQGFFALLRSCNEEANNRPVWQKLRLVIMHSTENYGTLNINQSPFNIGVPIELTEFTSNQVKDLAQRHQLNWDDNSVQQLMGMVGGHPYLVRVALYQAQHQGKWGNLTELLQDATTDTGIYDQHLWRHLSVLRKNEKLAAAFQQIININESVQLDPILIYQLYSMGLIKWENNKLMPRCLLYRQYFKERL